MRKRSKISWKNVFTIVLFAILLLINIALTRIYYDTIGFCKMQAYAIERSTYLMSKIGGENDL